MTTSKQKISDLEQWIKETLFDTSSLEPDTLKVVEGFVILWNIFEGSMCESNANVTTFEKIANKIQIRSQVENSINSTIFYYQNRYVEDQLMKPIFNGLNFRKNDLKLFVEKVLKGEKYHIKDKIFALLIIAYRIRCNLFHGLKSVVKWNEQAENIFQVSCVLKFMIECGKNQKLVKY